MNDVIPYPGSDEALKQGCRCPVLDNCHGKGIPKCDCPPLFWPEEGVDPVIGPTFWVNDDCPMHGKGKEGGSHDPA
jgi:hypothetical protein